MPQARYAIYFAPPHLGELDRLATQWIGRDAFTGSRIAPTGLGRIGASEQEVMTAEPRRYGFHATLKPPFRLKEVGSLPDLLKAVEAFAAARAAVALPGLRTVRLGSFIALVPARPVTALDALAADCVRAFEPFRASSSEVELARRRRGGLTPRQDELLTAWGYPYVMEEFRFHLTLTGPLPADVVDAALATLSEAFDPLCGSPFPVDSIAVFEEAAPGADFEILQRFQLSREAR